MITFDTFLEELQTALNHLYDPAFRPSRLVREVLGAADGSRSPAEALRQAIEEMAPPPLAPPESRGHRLHQVLVCRYLQQLTQEATAEQLHITARHVRREQNDAVQVLARLLWEGRNRAHAIPAAESPPPAPDSRAQSSDWSVQLRQELTALQRRAPSGAAEVGEALHRVVELLAPVLQKSGVTLHLGELSTGLFAAVQPAGLRQLLVRNISEWSRHLKQGRIEASAGRDGDFVTIHLVGSQAAIEHLPEDPLLQELLTEYGGRIHLQQDEGQTRISISLPAAPPVRVLVVDDNEDLLHFYRRYLQETRYQIIPLTDGTRLIATVESMQPDIIILDVMLPTTDGWELLTLLRQHPLGRQSPILICSVIQEEELALALGASGYIRKPVRRSSLLQALDAAMHQRGAEGPE
jgi:CheY-like chemotaxis protein